MGKKDRYWVGFDLGGTKMLAKVFDSKFRGLAQSRTKTKGYEGVEAGLERIVRTIHEALKEADIDPKNIAGVGVGCPGPLDGVAGLADCTRIDGHEFGPFGRVNQELSGLR